MDLNNGIVFNEENHEYSRNGVRIPSVTEILSMITSGGYSKINPAVLEHAAMKGTLVHEWCEMYDYGCADEFMPSEIVPYCEAYMEFVRDYRPKWEKIEEIVAYDDDYAGRVDRYGKIDGVNAVVDIKTITSPSSMTHLAVCCQTAAYMDAIVHASKYWIYIKRYALYLKPDGKYRLLDCEEFEDENNFGGGTIFDNLLDLYWKIHRIGRSKK